MCIRDRSDALYGTNGIIGITDEDRQNYLDENYVRVRHIYVNNKYMYATDEDGVQEYTCLLYTSTPRKILRERQHDNFSRIS